MTWNVNEFFVKKKIDTGNGAGTIRVVYDP